MPFIVWSSYQNKISEYQKRRTISVTLKIWARYTEKTVFEKLNTFQKCMSHWRFCHPKNFSVFDRCYFLCHCLQWAENYTNCSNEPTLSSFGFNLWIRRRLLWVNSNANEPKNVHNDVSKDWPITKWQSVSREATLSIRIFSSSFP